MTPERIDILVVEDNPGHALLTHVALVELDPPVRYALARDGEEALNFLFAKGDYSHRSNAPPGRPWCCSASTCPLMDGKTFLRALKAKPRTHDIPVVMFTASDDEMDVAMCRLMGAADYLSKSPQVGQYIDSIGKVCRQWLSPDANGQMSLAA